MDEKSASWVTLGEADKPTTTYFDYCYELNLISSVFLSHQRAVDGDGDGGRTRLRSITQPATNRNVIKVRMLPDRLRF